MPRAEVRRRRVSLPPAGTPGITAPAGAGPREHGRQAARSKRSRTGGQARTQRKPATPAPAQPAP